MLHMILSLIWCVLLFGVLPILAGRGCLEVIQRKSQEKNNPLTKCFLTGYLMLWTLIELISVPLTVLRLNYIILVVTVSIICMGFAAIGFWHIIGLMKKQHNEKKDMGTLRSALISVFRTKEDIVFFLIFLAGVLFVLYRMESTLFFDSDDSRFVVNAIDIVRSKRILYINPVTGDPISNSYHDFTKDLLGQWASFLAYGSIVSGIDTTVWAHMIYPLIGFILLLSVYWILLDEVPVSRESSDRSVVIKGAFSTAEKSLIGLVILAIYMYGYFSNQSAEVFSMIRIWQGKATLAGIGLLSLILCFMYIWKEPKNIEGYVLLFMANISACLMTSMGLAVAPIMIGIYSIVLAVSKKSLRVIVLSAIICVPNVLLYLLGHFYTLARHMR